MHRGSIAFATLLLCFAATASTSLCVDRPTQQQTAGREESKYQPPPPPSSEFELKIVDGKFLVRQKGNQEWKQSSELADPIAVGVFDGAHNIYVGTKAIKPPKAKHTEDPRYPTSERNSGIQGRVSMHIVVDELGGVRFPAIDVSPGPKFAEAAIEAVEKWRFKPATLNGQPIAVLMNVVMEFHLYQQFR